ncbi:MAG: class I SAM-dependent methyltransferase [Myxococcales bacterium]|nr:class I SAM-dependent methyltransferase [Myxococcales bacterium]
MKLRTVIVVGTLALSLGACKKSEKPAPAPSAPADAAESPEAAAKRAQVEKVAAARTRLDERVAKEAARWTPELEAKAAALRATDHASTDAALTAILASDHRQPGNADRDQYRHPRETLAFFGIEPTSRVVELGAGAGWYTEILAPLVGKRGALTVVGPDPEGPADAMSSVYGQRLVKTLAKSPGLFAGVTRVAIAAPTRMALGDAGSADVVIAFREMHNWVDDGNLPAYLAAIHAVLKDGGTFALIDHRAAPGAKLEDVVKQGYLPEAWVIEQVTAAGFDLAAQSEVNANAKDTKDYKEGVWTLPPALTLGDVDKAKYQAIGESDRMTLKFVKRAAGAAPAATK